MVLKYLDKIGEITSIGVAKERIELLAAQLEAKEKECERLGQEIERVQLENDRLTGENNRLKDAADNTGQEPAGTTRLTDKQVEILRPDAESGPQNDMATSGSVWPRPLLVCLRRTQNDVTKAGQGAVGDDARHYFPRMVCLPAERL